MADPSTYAPTGGALSGAFMPSGGSGTPPLTAAASQPGVDFASLVTRYGPQQAAAMAPSMGIAIDPRYTDMLAQQSQDVMGTGTGPLSQQIQSLQTNEQKAVQEKKDRIAQAMATLQVNQSNQTTNLPLLAASAAMLAPTRTGAFTESLSNGLNASIAPTEQQRQKNLDYAKLQGSLGVDSADVDVGAATQQTQNFLDRFKISSDDLKYAAASGARMQANANTNDTRIVTTGMRDATSEANNQNTVDARNMATGATAAYRAALTDLNGQKLSETERHNQAMETVRQQMAQQGQGTIAQKDWSDYQSRVTGNMNAISKTMQGMNLSPEDLRAKAIEMTVPPAITGKNLTPKAAPAPTQKQPQQGGQPAKQSLDDIFNPQPTQ